jgi:lipoate-protein ligase A
MPQPFRLIDGGLADGRRQASHDAALVELHAAGRVPDTLRFMRCSPSVILGRHQALGGEIDLDLCRAEGVGVVRRLTGGGTIYVDERQLGWEIVFGRDRMPGPIDTVARTLCGAVTSGLVDAFGIDASYRARHDIAVDGRRLGASVGHFQGDTIVCQGVLWVDLDPNRILPFLTLPSVRLSEFGCCAAADRMTSLRALLGEAPSIEDVRGAVLSGLASRLGIEVAPAEATLEEIDLAARRHAQEIGTDAFVLGPDRASASVLTAERSAAGHALRVDLRVEGARIREALFTGDLDATPARVVYDLEARLRDVPATQAPAVTEAFLSGALSLLALPVSLFREVVEDALAPAFAY